MTVGRFQVMATLQAARALVLGLPEPSAKSWGLNRAIFYAAAKRGFKGKPSIRRALSEVKEKPLHETREEFYLGSEMAFKAEKVPGGPFFIIGDKIQTEEEFSRQIEARFSGNFEEAFKEAVKLVQNFDKAVLLSQNQFYNQIYKPNRDTLATKWSKEFSK